MAHSSCRASICRLQPTHALIRGYRSYATLSLYGISDVHVLPISLAFALALSIEHLSADCLLEQDLAESYADADELAHEAYNLYSKFRPQIPEGQAGWGKKGLLDLQQIKELHKS